MDQSIDMLSTIPKALLIKGEWCSGHSGERFAIHDPATGEQLAEVADARVEDAVRAMEVCAAVQPAWGATAPRERAELLSKAGARMLAEEERLATIITLEMGKSLAEARGEVRYSADFLNWFAGEAVRGAGSFSRAPAGDAWLATMREPVGPCILVTPWNFPLAMAARKVAPAIAAGCTMVVKPAQQTPLSALAFGHLLMECGLPAGVLNILPSTNSADVVGACLKHRAARKLSFTGSTFVGRVLAREAADNLLRVSLELGGNNPFLVFEDADLDAAIDGAMLAKMRNVGEACTAANRFLVHRSVADAFAERLATRMSELSVGHGLSGANVGPLIDQRARDRVAGLVEDAVAAGARLLAGGHAVPGPGCFYAPTVLADLPHDAAIVQGEIFGPVAPIQSFDSEAEAIALANDSPYGLAAYVYTRDISRGLRVMEALQAGMVGINRGLISDAAAPFGGVKHSGLGREGGREGIEEYQAVKYASIAR